MTRQKPDSALCPAFECFHIDSAASPDLVPIRLHSHYFSEILLVREGTCRIIRSGIPYTVKAGEAIHFSPLVPHSVESADGGPYVFDVVKYSLTRLKEIPAYLSNLRSLSLDAASMRLPVCFTAQEVKDCYLGHIISQCILENERRGFVYETRVRALIYLIVTAIARLWFEKRASLGTGRTRRNDPVLGVPAYIEQHLSESLKVEDLAAMCGMSYPWFAKRFREFFGVGCKQFIEYVRIDFAEQYLIYSDLDLEEISRRTGFTDSSHMVKDFRRMNHITPGQFRSLVRAESRIPD